MAMFIDAQRLASSRRDTRVPTGSPQLDELTGGIESGAMYLFYGDDELIETLFTHLLANSLNSTDHEPEAVYVICGNYRREHIMMDTEGLIRLLEARGQDPEDSLKRVRVLVASSADQQANLTVELERVVESSNRIRLVLVRGIYRLGRDDARRIHREKVAEEVQRSIAAIKRICASAGVPLVASARERFVGKVPVPEASSYLDHLAGVIVYLRRREKGAAYNRAYVLKSPLSVQLSMEYSYVGESYLGRTTPPIRMSFEALLARLRSEYREALVKVDRREAFDRLVEAWSQELGAISYAESMSLMDLIILTGLVDDRSVSEELRTRISDIERRITRLEER
jgi:KaiC/GvpD/RAD55 family RecA-like ATPase